MLSRTLIFSAASLFCLGSGAAQADEIFISLSDNYVLYHEDDFLIFGNEEELSAGIRLADFDRDGDLDIAYINGRHWAQPDRMLLNNGGGQFPMAQSFGNWETTGYGACVTDFNNDDLPDLLVSRDLLPALLLENQGDGQLTDFRTLGPPGSARDCFIEDVNNDGHDDLVIADRGGESFLMHGPLAEATDTIPLFEGAAVGANGADLNQDGRTDIVLALRGEATFALLMSDADGYASPVTYGSDNAQSRSTALADWDGDGDIDIIAAVLTGANQVWLNEAGEFSETIQLGPRDEESAAVGVGDFNGDGRPDAVFGNRGENSIVLNLETGPKRIVIPDAGDAYDLAIGDLNGDDFPDIAFTNSGALNTIYFSGRLD